MDSNFDDLMSACGNGQSTMDLLITECALVRLTDKAFQKRAQEEKWDQNHLGLVGSSQLHPCPVVLCYQAFKFESDPAWHCVWAAMVEHDHEQGGQETFRSYEDVYLQPVSPSVSPSKPRFPGRKKRRIFDGK